MNNYYIYIYLDPRKPGKYCYKNFSFLYKPFYIGKGKNGRYKIYYSRNPFFKNKINKIKKSGLEPIVIKLYENLNEKESLKKEVELIDEIGRLDLGTGPLINMTDGGEGVSGKIVSEETKEKLRKDFQDIKKEFEKRNYILLTEEKDYKTNKTKLKYICPKGHKHHIKWNDFQQRYNCPYCAKKKIYFSEIKKEFEKRNYILLTEEKDYKTNKTKLKYICPKGHDGFISWHNFQQYNNHTKYNGCPICCNKLRSENNKGENNFNNKNHKIDLNKI